MSQIENLFKNLKVERVRFYGNKISALSFDLEYSNLFIIKNIILRIIGLPLYLNFKLSKSDFGTFLGINLVKSEA